MPQRDPDTLTPREREVPALLRCGLTNEEIAGRLGFTLDGAKYHVSQILSKLGVATLCVSRFMLFRNTASELFAGALPTRSRVAGSHVPSRSHR